MNESDHQGGGGSRISWAMPAVFVLSLLNGTSLLFSAFVHFTRPWDFLESVLLYDLLPQPWTVWLVPILLFLMAAIGLSLIIGTLRPGVHFLAGFIFLIFFVAQGLALARGKKIPCGCFGEDIDVIGVESMTIPAVLLLSAMVACWIEIRHSRSKTASVVCSRDQKP